MQQLQERSAGDTLVYAGLLTIPGTVTDVSGFADDLVCDHVVG